jgi:hypothetical protein
MKNKQKPQSSICPNCGLNIYTDCPCYTDYLDNQFPFRPIGEDAYATARPYTPQITEPPKRKRGLFG